MMNSKLEKVLLVFVWYVLLITFRLVLPISEPPGNIDKYVVIFLSILVTFIVYRVYIHYRNKHILKNLENLLQTNQLDEAIKYINMCLSRQKKNRSVYAYKLYVLAMCGHVTEFEKMLSECKKSNKYKKLVNLDFVQGLICIVNFFKTRSATVMLINLQSWSELINALSEQENEKSIPVLLSVYSNAKFCLIKSVFAFKLYLTYLKIEKIEKAQYYYNEALKYAPSLEIAYYIESTGNLKHQKAEHES